MVMEKLRNCPLQDVSCYRSVLRTGTQLQASGRGLHSKADAKRPGGTAGALDNGKIFQLEKNLYENGPPRHISSACGSFLVHLASSGCW